MRRLAFVVALVAAACGSSTKLPPGPSDTFYKPVGVGVVGGKDCTGNPDPACQARSSRLVVASSNSDLRFDDPTGGSVIAVDPSIAPATLDGTLNIRSFAGQLVVADPAACPIDRPDLGAITVVPVRGDDVLYRIRTSPEGALTCNGCETSLVSQGWADAFSAGLACGPGIARAYVGFLRSAIGQAVVSQVDLTKDPSDPRFLQTAALDFGVASAFAYDAPRKRLYATRTATGSAGLLSWVSLGSDCNWDPERLGVACLRGSARAPNGIELRGMVLASSEAAPRRAYFTARIFDAIAAASAGVRVGDFDGLLIVADLVENLSGDLEIRIVNQIAIGYGAGEVVRLPPRGNGERDIVAALAADDSVLWIYDDETGESVAIGRDLIGDSATGAPLVGHSPFGLAVDPLLPTSRVARVYVGSFQESFVTPIDVPIDDIRLACPVAQPGKAPPSGCPAYADILRITGGAR